MRIFSLNTMVLLGLLFLSGCDNEPPTKRVAYLVDSPVDGVDYVCGTASGVTSNGGEAVYYTTSNCTALEFKLNNLSLGSIPLSSIASDGKITLQELARSTRDDVTNATALSLGMLLQSLDSDNNPENGITISSSDKATFTETSLTSTEITNKITSLGKPIVSEFEASAHILKQTKLLASSMNKIVTFPKNNAPHTQTGPFTWIRFSVGEALDPATLIPANILVSSNNTLQSCSYDSRTFIVSCLAPSTGFVASNEYSISLTSSIKKANGTSITPTTISFSVDHPTLAPRIKTGQTTSYASGDDGSYASTLGIAKNSSSLSWSNINNTPATLTGAKAYCTGLNTNNGSWRLPTAKELMTLVDQSNTTSTTPALAILNGIFWTSSELSSGGKWAIDFGDYGNDITILDGTNTHNTICVSATQTNNNQYIRDISKQIILDSQSGLIWQDTSDNNNNVSTWNEAIGYCENLTLGGFNDWRLPNHQELYQTINKPTDTTNKPNFLYSITNNYWTSTTYTGNTNEAWAVSANDGSNTHPHKNSELHTRCVRGGL